MRRLAQRWRHNTWSRRWHTIACRMQAIMPSFGHACQSAHMAARRSTIEHRLRTLGHLPVASCCAAAAAASCAAISGGAAWPSTLSTTRRHSTSMPVPKHSSCGACGEPSAAGGGGSGGDAADSLSTCCAVHTDNRLRCLQATAVSRGCCRRCKTSEEGRQVAGPASGTARKPSHRCCCIESSSKECRQRQEVPRVFSSVAARARMPDALRNTTNP